MSAAVPTAVPKAAAKSTLGPTAAARASKAKQKKVDESFMAESIMTVREPEDDLNTETTARPLQARNVINNCIEDGLIVCQSTRKI